MRSGAVPPSGPAGVRTSADRRSAEARAVRHAVLHDRGFRWAATAALGWLALYAALTALTTGSAAAGRLVSEVVYLVPIAAATVLAVLVVTRTAGRTRRVWVLLAGANTLWLAGEVVWSWYTFARGAVPFPSVADVLYLAAYVLVPPALLVAFTGSGILRQARGLGDGVLAAVVLGMAGWRLLLAPQLTDGVSVAALTGIAYPLMGVVILVLLVTVGLADHRLVSPAVLLVGAAYGCAALTDTGYTYLAVLATYESGYLELGWQAQAVLLCLAALVVLRHGDPAPQRQDTPHGLGSAPVVIAVAVTVALYAAEAWESSSRAVLLLGALTAGYVVVRFSLVLHEQRRLTEQLQDTLAEQERLAVTDGLTGLHNRRFLTEMLRLETERARRDGTPLALLVLDLDLFKQVNDRYGHAVGDRVLAEAARRLRGCARSTDILARYGGEEFVLVLPGRDAEAAREVGERCRQAMRFRPFTTEDGAWIRVTVSVGCAATGGTAPVDADALVLEADHALYTAKELGRDRVVLSTDLAADDQRVLVRQPGGVPLPSGLVRLAELVERSDGLPGHSRAVARWADLVAERLELTALQRSRLRLAARLHDLGKLSAPTDLLTTTETLDARQWQVVHRYPEVGALVLGTSVDLVDVARIVRCTRECYDGSGYPDGRSGDAIPVEARVLAVCDAWAAIRADRPRRGRRSREEARSEMLAGRGSQFDPAALDAFLALEAEGLVGDLPSGDPEAAGEPSLAG